jgi:hypothetical protein
VLRLLKDKIPSEMRETHQVRIRVLHENSVLCLISIHLLLAPDLSGKGS